MESTKVNFFYDQLLVKEPGTAERTPWHQDQPYWAVAGRQVCSLWVPFDPVPEETCVEYVAGSHDWPEFSPYHFADGTPYANTGLPPLRSEEHTSELQSLMRISYAVFCLQKKKTHQPIH